MTDLERLEEAWPLGWVSTDECDNGYDATVGDATLEAQFALDVWTFWFRDEDDYDEIGNGSLRVAAGQAARFLAGRRNDAIRKSKSLILAVGRYDEAERSEA